MKRIGAPWRGILGRLHGEERGFTLLEVVFAITVMFVLLLTLAYTATTGFSYESLAREKQTATSIANQIMEQTRGLAWDKITTGHLSTDLGAVRSDLIVTQPDNGYLVTGCSGDAAGVYRLLSCTAGTTPGSGEQVVASAPSCSSGSPDCVSPLVRHAGQITQNNVVYTWRTYDTNNCPPPSGCSGVTDPYRVTVIVTWTTGKAAPNKIVQLQSLFWSPSGCRSTATHPFAAPCQPFFYGTATVPQADVSISGSIALTTFQSGDLLTSGVQSALQQEQLSQVQGSFTQSGVKLTDLSGTQTAGGVVANSSAADTDPGTTAGTWSRVRCGDPGVACSGGQVLSSSGTGNTITLKAPNGETAETDSTTAAGGTNVCPPPSDTAQTDGRSCGGSRIQQGGTLSAILTLNGTLAQLGDAKLAQILQPANPSKTFADRVGSNQSPAGLLCTPTNNSDGCVEEQASRTLGTLNVGGLPSQITAPTGWPGSNPWNGYYLSVVGYQDSATAAAGTNVVSPTTTPQVPAPTVSGPSGTVYCWNGSNGYNSASAGSTTPVTCGDFNTSQTVNGHIVSLGISGTVSAATITRNPTSAGTTATSATAQVTPPSATITYSVSVDLIPVASLTIAVNLGVLDVEGSYAIAPGSGT